MKYALVFFVLAVLNAQAQKLSPVDFERLRGTGNFSSYLKTKGFLQSATDTAAKPEALTYTNTTEGSIVLLNNTVDGEGARGFTATYLLPTAAAYEAFIAALKKAGYADKKAKGTYTKFISTYERQYFVTEGEHTRGTKKFYQLKYAYTAGKEIAEPH
ncbi:MAG: hypothetical protein U0V74_09220 [Chitinophagales bacterium]